MEPQKKWLYWLKKGIYGKLRAGGIKKMLRQVKGEGRKTL